MVDPEKLHRPLLAGLNVVVSPLPLVRPAAMLPLHALELAVLLPYALGMVVFRCTNGQLQVILEVPLLFMPQWVTPRLSFLLLKTDRQNRLCSRPLHLIVPVPEVLLLRPAATVDLLLRSLAVPVN